jgi:hypothetical protein
MNGSSLYFRAKLWEKRDIACYTSTSSNTCTKLFKAAFLKRVHMAHPPAKAGVTTGKTNNIISYDKGFCLVADILREENLASFRG